MNKEIKNLVLKTSDNRQYSIPINWTYDISSYDFGSTARQAVKSVGSYTIPPYFTNTAIIPSSLNPSVVIVVSNKVKVVFEGVFVPCEAYNVLDTAREHNCFNTYYGGYRIEGCYGDYIEIVSLDPDNQIEVYYNGKYSENNTVNMQAVYTDITVRVLKNVFDHYETISPVSIANGIEPTVENFGLPTAIKAYDVSGTEHDVTVAWSFVNYDRKKTSEHTFSLRGKATFPSTIIGTDNEKTVYATVNVAAAEEITNITYESSVSAVAKTSAVADVLNLPDKVIGTAEDGTAVEFNTVWDLSAYDETNAEAGSYTVTASLWAYGYKASDISMTINTFENSSDNPYITADFTPESDDRLVVDPRNEISPLSTAGSIILPAHSDRRAVFTLPNSFEYHSVGDLSQIDEIDDFSVDGRTLTIDFAGDEQLKINLTINLSVNKSVKAGACYAPGQKMPLSVVYTAKKSGENVTNNFVADYAVLKNQTDCFNFVDLTSTFNTPQYNYRWIPTSSANNILTSAQFLNQGNSAYNIRISDAKLEGAPYLKSYIRVEIPMPDNFAIRTDALGTGAFAESYDSATNTYVLLVNYSDRNERLDVPFTLNALPIYCISGLAQDGAVYEAASTIKLYASSYVDDKELAYDTERKVKISCCTRSTGYSTFAPYGSGTVAVVPNKDTVTSVNLIGADLLNGNGLPLPESNYKVKLTAPDGAFIENFSFNFGYTDDTTIYNGYALSSENDTYALSGKFVKAVKPGNAVAQCVYSSSLSDIPDDKKIVEIGFTIDNFDYHDFSPLPGQTNRSDLTGRFTCAFSVNQKKKNGTPFAANDKIYPILSIESDNAAKRECKLEIKFTTLSQTGNNLPNFYARAFDTDKIRFEDGLNISTLLVSDDPSAVNEYVIDFDSKAYSNDIYNEQDRKLVFEPKEGLRINMFRMGEFNGVIPAKLTLNDSSVISLDLTSNMKYVLPDYISERDYITKFELDLTDNCPQKLKMYPYGYLSAQYFLNQFPGEVSHSIFDGSPFVGSFLYKGERIASAGKAKGDVLVAVLRVTDTAGCGYTQPYLPVSYPIDGYTSTAEVNIQFGRTLTPSINAGRGYHPDGLSTDVESALISSLNYENRSRNLGSYELKFKLADGFTYVVGSAEMKLDIQHVMSQNAINSVNEYIDADGYVHIAFDGNSVFEGTRSVVNSLTFDYLTSSDAVPSSDPVTLIIPDSFSDSLAFTGSYPEKLDSDGTNGAELSCGFASVNTADIKAIVLSYSVQGLSSYGYANNDSTQRGFGPISGHGDAGESFRYVTKVRTDGSSSFSDMTMYIPTPQLNRINTTRSASYEQEWSAVLTGINAPSGYVIEGTTDENPSSASAFTALNQSDKTALSAVTMLKVTAISANNGDEVSLTLIPKDGTAFSGNPTAYMFTEYKYGGMTAGRTEFTRAVSYLLTHYSVRYDLNGGTGEAPIDTNEYLSGDTAAVITQTAITKSGFTFGGWSLTSGGKTAVQSVPITTSSVTLYAIWNVVPQPTVTQPTSTQPIIRNPIELNPPTTFPTYPVVPITRETKATTRVELAPEADMTIRDEVFSSGAAPSADNHSPMPIVFILLILSASVLAKYATRKNK